MTVIEFAQTRARTTIAAFFFLLIAGAYAFSVVPKEADPDISIPIVYVSLFHDGISPEDAEKLLLRPIEKELRSLEGLKELSSTSYEDGGNVVAEFHAGSDIAKALDDVREKVSKAKSELPDDAEEPSVNEVNLNRFPVLNISLYGDVPYRLLRRSGRLLRDEIEALPNVLGVDIVGDREEVVEAIISPRLLESHNLQAQELLLALQRANLLIAAGALNQRGGRFAVEVAGRIDSANELLDLPLIANGEGVVRVRDVAEVRRTFKESESASRVNGRAAVTLLVKKRTGRNIIETIDQVRAVVKQAEQQLPAGVQILVGQDKSEDIRRMLKDLQNNITSAILLVMVVVLATLGFRCGLLVGLTIPGSFLTAILLLYALGFTMNIVVLFALILSVGMLVDGAIVVSEYAQRRYAEGVTLVDAFSQAARRMAWPIIASTATTLAAFVPLAFWPGIVGEFMRYLPITVIATLSMSLLMALIFLPVLGTHLHTIGKIVFVALATAIGYISLYLLTSLWLGGLAILFGLLGAGLAFFFAFRLQALPARRRHKNPQKSSPHPSPSPPSLSQTSPASLPQKGFTALYVRFLGILIQHPAKVLIAALLLLIGTYTSYGIFGRGVEFFPDIEPELFIVDIAARGNLSLSEKASLVGEVERHVLDLQAERGEFKIITSQIGYREGDNNDSPDDSIGEIGVQLTNWRTRRKAEAIIADIQTRISDIAGLHLQFIEDQAGPPTEDPIHVRIGGEDWPEIVAAARRIRAFMESDSRFIDIQDSLPVADIVWKLDLDRHQALKFGVDAETLGSFVKFLTQGLKITDIQPDDSDDEVDIIVRFPRQERSLNQLQNLRINTPNGVVPADLFIQRIATPSRGIIRRIDAQRIHFVKSDVATGVLTDSLTRELQDWLNAQSFGNVEISLQGENVEQEKARAFLSKAFAVALFIMAVVLLTQFNNFYSVVMILTAVIMSTLGVLLGLLITAQPFGIVMCGIGVIALAGIVVNNNIVLIDTYDKYAAQDMPVRRAILQTAAERLRPVLLTTVTTILGLLPMTLKMNIDFFAPSLEIGGPSTQWWSQLSTAIVFGLLFATLLTLIVTPSALALREKIGLLPHSAKNADAAVDMVEKPTQNMAGGHA